MPSSTNKTAADEARDERRQEMDPDGFLDDVAAWQARSFDDLSRYQARWAENLKIMKGVWAVDEKTRSVVRGRSKIYFRKVWATVWRLVASLYNAFLRDPDVVKFEPRYGTTEDVHRAGVLQELVLYYRDYLLHRMDLFIQFVWAFYNILVYGLAVGLFSWEYEPGSKKDHPSFKIWPPEQVFPDMDATMESEMGHIIFESFHSLDVLKQRGYDNLDLLEPSTPAASTLRSVRHLNTQDPAQNPGDKEYPAPGRFQEAGNPQQEEKRGKYKVWQTFYRRNGKIYYGVSSGGDVVLKKPVVSKYGECFPIAMGTCLTEPHKLVGEGFPEPLEAPQVSLNDVINRRKDNVALVMNKHTFVSRFGNVDLASLTNSRAGGTTLMDDVNAVREREMQDVTQSAYAEAAADEGMMQEMSGVTPSKEGMDRSSKATTAQINLTESNAKVDLFIAIAGETFVKRFYQQLAYMVSRFHTDQKALDQANRAYRSKKQVDHWQLPGDVTDLDDLDAHVIVSVGIGTVSRDIEVKQLMLAMDKAVMSNQALAAILQTGVIPPKEIQLTDTSKLLEQLYPKIGLKNVHDYFFKVQPPPPQPPAGGGGPSPAPGLGNMPGGPAAMAGMLQPHGGPMNGGAQ